MPLRRICSAISYAAVASALSGPVAAAPADVSGVNHTTANAHSASQSGFNNAGRPVYFALNRGLGAIPGMTVTAPAPAGSRAQTIDGYDPNFLDGIEQRLNAELNTLIELRSR